MAFNESYLLCDNIAAIMIIPITAALKTDGVNPQSAEYKTIITLVNAKLTYLLTFNHFKKPNMIVIKNVILRPLTVKI